MIEQNALNRTVVGRVVSNKMDKTIVVQVERKVKHPLYGKYMRRFSKMYAHDAENTCMVGDVVLIQQSRPLSKTKNWVLVEVMERADKEIAG
ncbi:MAG: 30S ribosomal protein S17 [Gammaproteobacteria bacterium]